jgi:transposase
MQPHDIGLDFSRILVEVYGVDADGKLVVHKRAPKNEIKGYLSRLRPCKVGLEACGNAHHWVEELGRLGHDVRLIPPQITASYRGHDGSACCDAEAICRALAGLHEKSERTTVTFLSSMCTIFRASHYSRKRGGAATGLTRRF